MASNSDNFLQDVWAIRSDGKKVFPYKGEKGEKKGLYSVNFTNDTNNFQGYTEEQVINAIEEGRFKDRGTIRMLPMDYKPGDERSAYAPEYYKGKSIKSLSSASLDSYKNPVIEPEEKKEAASKENPVDEITYRSIKSRRGQAEFRKALLAAYNETCCISKCGVLAVLEAAHIIPHTEETNYSVSNGLLLRADIHTLYDLNLIGVDASGTVHISTLLRNTEYSQYEGVSLGAGVPQAIAENLAQRFSLFENQG
jgi:hypothetical protein